MTFPGPSVLGRGLVVLPGSAVPPAFADVERIVVDDAALKRPRPVVDRLHQAWAARQPIVIELSADANVIRTPEVQNAEPWELDPDFEFPLDRLQFLLWANNYDARSGEPKWWWPKKAARAFGGRVQEDGVADALFDGTPVWCDGGPRETIPMDLLDGHRVLHRDAIESGSGNLMAFEYPQSELAEDQRRAVLHAVGPARVIAPAGSGKTRVLTERLRHLITDRQWESQSVLVLAYNKRAADEMIERTPGIRTNIRTLNSLGLAICNGTGGFASPQGRPFRNVIDEVEVRRMLDRLVEVKLAANTDPYAPFLEGLRAIRLALMDPSEAEVAFEATGLAEVFDKLVTQMEERGVIDFDGQLYEAIRILLTDPVARAQARSVGRHLLVDEFQDLTPAHLLLIRLIAAPVFDVFAVGDDDQVIYGFGGATPEFLVNFDQYFPGAKHHALEVNYRCSPSVIKGARHLLSYNRTRIEKDIRAPEARIAVPGEFTLQKATAVEAAPRTMDLIEEWHAEGLDYTQMAVLTRVNSTLLPVQIMLTQAGVPCRAPLTESILERTGTRAALAYLRMGMAPDAITRRDIQETIRRPSRRIARNVVDMMTKRGTSSVSGIRRLSDSLTGNDAQKVLNYAADLDKVRRSLKNGDVSATLRLIRVQVGLGDAMDALDGSRREADRSTHNDDLIALEQVAALHPEPETFEAWLRQSLRNRPEVDGVELSTIHRVKGREWPNVIVYAADEGLLPHRLASDFSEERRLFHVAITRSSQKCVVLSDNANPSSFLSELTGEKPHRKAAEPATPARAGKAAPEMRKVEAELGLTVRLTAGYEGEVVEVREDSVLVAVDGAKMTVKFGEPVRIGKGTVVLVAAKDEAPIPEGQQALYDALVEWRRTAAASEGTPPYVVLSNADAMVIAEKAPTNVRDLAKCRGMGPKRLERWADEILAVVEAVMVR